jgi:hypothetical protein
MFVDVPSLYEQGICTVALGGERRQLAQEPYSALAQVSRWPQHSRRLVHAIYFWWRNDGACLAGVSE